MAGTNPAMTKKCEDALRDFARSAEIRVGELRVLFLCRRGDGLRAALVVSRENGVAGFVELVEIEYSNTFLKLAVKELCEALDVLSRDFIRAEIVREIKE